MELERLDKLMGEFLPIAKGATRAGQEVPFREAVAAARIVLHIIDQRMKLLSYEDVPPINRRKIRAFVDTLTSLYNRPIS